MWDDDVILLPEVILAYVDSAPSDCHVKKGVHSVVKTVCMLPTDSVLTANAVLTKSTAATPAHMAQ